MNRSNLNLVVLAVRPRLLCEMFLPALSLSSTTTVIANCANSTQWPTAIEWGQTRWLITTPLDDGQMSDHLYELLATYPSLAILLLSADSEQITIHFTRENGSLDQANLQNINLERFCTILNNSPMNQ